MRNASIVARRLPAPARPTAFAALVVAGAAAHAQHAPPGDAGPLAVEPSAAVVTVTGTRESRLLAQTPASIGVVDEQAIRRTGPTHPQQILGQVPGVAVNVTNGEGHTTAIRQPFTTAAVYLFLEDGIPIRATGFFNHNALYEVDIPSAGRLEVVRGPGTALYGSDAVAGTVNVLGKPAASTPELGLTAELGAFGWRRLLLDGSTGVGADAAVRATANLSHSDGWRDATDYDRGSVNLRWEHTLGGGAELRTLFGATRIDQASGANTALPRHLYEDAPTTNLMPIAFRKVTAVRMSTQYERQGDGTLLSVTPYLRSNTMDLNGTFNLSSDPRIERSEVASVGVMAKWRRDFALPGRPRIILGVDIDHSPGRRVEDGLVLQKSGRGAETAYHGYAVGERIYDYDVTFDSVSPYVHAEWSPLPPLRLSAGLRHDRIRYDATNRIAAATTRQGPRFYGQWQDASVSYERLSPKLGATWALSRDVSLYASWNQGFRAPSEGQLFRAGSAANADDALNKARLALALEPIKAAQAEVGVRGDVAGWRVEAVAYRLDKRDDLVSQRDLATNVSTAVNAGRTRHQGLELGLGRALAKAWRVDAALSFARHRYVDWVAGGVDRSGHEIEAAPRTLGNVRLTCTPRAGTTAQLEWVHVGSWWLEAGNSAVFGKYPGHDVFHLRASHRLTPHVSLFGRVMNLADTRYADSASVSSNTPVYSPALPRALYAGLKATW